MNSGPSKASVRGAATWETIGYNVSLDLTSRIREAASRMRNLTLPLAAVALSISLAACQPEPETVSTTAPDPLADEIANAAPVELPPPVKASVTFRCQPGNVLRYVDFFQGDLQVNFRVAQGDSPIRLKAPTAGEPFTGEGISVTGDPSKATITTGDGELTCSA